MAKKKNKKSVMCYQTEDKTFRYFIKNNGKAPKTLKKYHPAKRQKVLFTLSKP